MVQASLLKSSLIIRATVIYSPKCVGQYHSWRQALKSVWRWGRRMPFVISSVPRTLFGAALRTARSISADVIS
jgi:hypothetical protein